MLKTISLALSEKILYREAIKISKTLCSLRKRYDISSFDLGQVTLINSYPFLNIPLGEASLNSDELEAVFNHIIRYPFFDPMSIRT